MKKKGMATIALCAASALISPIALAGCTSSVQGAVVIKSYEMGGTGEYDTFAAGDGDAVFSAKEIEIPSEFNGRPITYIMESGFRGCAELEKVTLRENLEGIDDHAFAGCSSLKNIVIPDTVFWMGEYAFARCPSLSEVTMPFVTMKTKYTGHAGHDSFCDIFGDDNAVKKVVYTELGENETAIFPEYWFSGCDSLEYVELPDELRVIGSSAFRNCKSLEKITIPRFVNYIDTGAFYGCSSLSEIILPESIGTIGNDAFYGCDKLESVYYCGTEEQFENIYNKSDYHPFYRATIYYYSQSQPQEEGDFWHYAADGKTPVVWGI